MKIVTFFALLSLPLLACAQDSMPNYDLRLQLHLINNSNRTLVYTGFSGENMGNSFTVNTPVIKPGETMDITGTTTKETDLCASLTFRNEVPNSADMQQAPINFTVCDPREFHDGNPNYQFAKGSNLVAGLINETRDPNHVGHYLLDTSATVSINADN